MELLALYSRPGACDMMAYPTSPGMKFYTTLGPWNKICHKTAVWVYSTQNKYTKADTITSRKKPGDTSQSVSWCHRSGRLTVYSSFLSVNVFEDCTIDIHYKIQMLILKLYGKYVLTSPPKHSGKPLSLQYYLFSDF